MTISEIMAQIEELEQVKPESRFHGFLLSTARACLYVELAKAKGIRFEKGKVVLP